MEVISVMQTNAKTREAADGEDRPEEAWPQAMPREKKLQLSVGRQSKKWHSFFFSWSQKFITEIPSLITHVKK